MRAELEDGTIVTLEKDCGCLDEIHTGPHWLHMDRFDREQSRKFLARGDALSLEAFLRNEQQRLQEKLYQMTSRRVKRLLPDDTSEPSNGLSEH